MVTYDECIRLVKGLGERGVSVKNVVVNQLLADSTDSKFVERLAASQAYCLRQVYRPILPPQEPVFHMSLQRH